MGYKLIDLTGQRFGRLVALEHPYASGMWLCQCDCGNTKRVASASLRVGCTRSCGCLNSERAAARKRTHGMSGTPEYKCWYTMKARCENPKCPAWVYYGARGIRLSPEWANSFETFLADVGLKPSPRHSIDRIDVNGHYERGNVRWATAREQANNKRDNHPVTWRGETKTIAEWARHVGLRISVLHGRIVKWGWPIERAMTERPHTDRSKSSRLGALRRYGHLPH